MKKKNKVLATSVATIALCASLVAGGTYALFTSESEVNIAVTSGTVKVVATVNEESLTTYSMDAVQDKGKFENGGTAGFNDKSQLQLSLMTPGDKAEFTVDIANESNIAIQYKISFDVTGGLADALECNAEKADDTWVYAEAKAEIPSVAVTVELPETAGNEYQGITDTVITVKVEAVQGNAFIGGATVEEDVNLEEVFTEDLLNKENIMIKLGEANLTWETGGGHGSTPFGNENTKSVTIMGESPEVSKLTATGAGVGPIRVDGGTLIVKNVEIIDMTKSYAENSWELGYLEIGDKNTDTLVFENCVFNKAIQITGDATFKNCKFNSNADSEYAVWVCGGNAEFESCEFTGPRGLKMHEAYGTEIESVTVNLCKFEDLAKKPGVAIGTLNADTEVTIQNSEFIDCQPGDQSLYVYESDTDVTTFTFVNKNNAVINSSAVVEATNNETLDEAIQGNKSVLQLGSGSYIIPDSAQGKELTIIGNGETKVAVQDDGSYEGCDYSFRGATVTFKNITINTDSSTYTGYAGLKAVYINCPFIGTYTLYGDSVFYNCTFNVSGDVYNIWTWGAPTVEFNNCTFNSDGKALLLYGTVDTKLTVNNCVFNDNGGLTDLKAAIEIGNDYGKSYTLTVNNTTVNGYEINDKGINTGSTLWANKNSMGTDNLNVVIDGVDVY